MLIALFHHPYITIYVTSRLCRRRSAGLPISNVRAKISIQPAVPASLIVHLCKHKIFLFTIKFRLLVTSLIFVLRNDPCLVLLI